jgi:PAS domain S-box-containing protein
VFREEELNLFVADDDSVSRIELRRTLTSIVRRAHVSDADTAAGAIDALCARPFDCAFLDYRLSDGDALKVMRTVRAAGVDTPIVILTSQGDETLAVEVMKAGASDYIPKARISRERLSQSLTGAIRLHRAERAKEQTEKLRQQAEDRVKFLSDASIILGGSLDYEGTLGNIARLAVPRFADLCIVDIYENGVMRRTAIAHSDPELSTFAASLKQYSPDPEGPHPAAAAIRTGQSQFSGEVSDSLMQSIAQTPDHLSLLRNLHFESYIVTPLIARGRTLGAISFIKSRTGTQYNDSDVLVAEELSRRAAVAVDNARLFAASVNEREELEASEERYRFLADSIPPIIWTATPEGTCNYLNRRWYDYTGLTIEQSLESGWLNAVHPDERERCERLWRASVSSGEPYEVECRLRHRGDGSYRWYLIRALPQRDPDQRTLLWFGTSTDIDDQKRNEQLQRYLSEASTILASSLDYEVTLPRIAALSVPQIADWCAIDLLEGQTIRRVAVAHVHPEKIDLAVEFHRRYPPRIDEMGGVALVLRTGQATMVREITDEMLAAGTPDPEQRAILQSLGLRSFICAPIRARGRTLGAITFVAAESGRLYGDSDLALANELAYRTGLAVDNAQLFIETQERAKREELINAIAKKLRASLDAGEIMRSALTEVGRAFGANRASWLRLNKERGIFEITPQQWCAPGISPFLRSYEVTAFPDTILTAYRRGEIVAINNLATDPRTVDFFHNPDRPPGAVSVLGCPVFVRDELDGILTVTTIDHERNWTSGEIDTLTAICSTLALALENARIYAREHRVADMLQSAFLANIPNRLPGLSVRSSYRAGLEESQVGGDFYDAFTLPDGRVAVVMADVSGKGLSAAVQTATVKYSLRAFAAEAAAPSLVLTRLNRMLRAESSGLGDHFVTLFYAVFDPGSGRLAYASAGHETQVVKRRTGGTTLMSATGPILGITEHRYEQAIDYLGPGDSVILFTDGLTEARSKARELLELNRVVAAIDRIPSEASAAAIVSRLERLAMNWAENRPHDDLALLVVRNDGDGTDLGFEEHELLAGSVPLQPGSDLELLFDFAFQSLPDYAAEVRQVLGHWMGALGFDREAIEDFQTAVTEAVTNAIRHGSPQGAEDQFLVRGYRSLDDAFIVEVGDRGPGLRVSVLEPQMPSPEASGGRGLPLMQVLADDVAYLPSAIAHWVRLIKRPVKIHLNGNGASPR